MKLCLSTKREFKIQKSNKRCSFSSLIEEERKRKRETEGMRRDTERGKESNFLLGGKFLYLYFFNSFLSLSLFSLFSLALSYYFQRILPPLSLSHRSMWSQCDREREKKKRKREKLFTWFDFSSFHYWLILTKFFDGMEKRAWENDVFQKMDEKERERERAKDEREIKEWWLYLLDSNMSFRLEKRPYFSFFCTFLYAEKDEEKLEKKERGKEERKISRNRGEGNGIQMMNFWSLVWYGFLWIPNIDTYL